MDLPLRYALVSGIRAEPQPKLTGVCNFCGLEMISKCGRYVAWHWAHKRKSSCDPWLEGETDWHLEWKDRFPKDWQEIVHVDDQTKERHIADVKTPSGLVIEIQHSPISEQELRSREHFYGNMIWIVDARDFEGYFSIGMTYGLASIDPLSYHIRWWGSSKLLQRWSAATTPVYFDIHSEENSNLLRLMEFNSAESAGILAPVPSDAVVNAALSGKRLPLVRCDESDAQRYSRYWKMADVPGMDDSGDK